VQVNLIFDEQNLTKFEHIICRKKEKLERNIGEKKAK